MASLPPSSAVLLDPDGQLPLWRRVLRHLLIGLLVSTLVGLFINLMSADGLWRNLVLSLCIGSCIQGLIELGRYGISAWMRQLLV